MSKFLIKNVRFVRPGVSVETGQLLIDNGVIGAVNPQDVPANIQYVDAGNRLLTPGLIDIHTHGITHYLYEATAEELVAGLGQLPQFGTTGVLPTLYSVMTRSTLKTLESLANAIDSVHAVSVPGLHLEGPFLKLPGAGCDTIDGDVGLLNELLAATGNRVAAMSVSPDTPNIISVIEQLVERRIVPFITHTQASVEETEKAIDAGARNATHFYDVFPVPETVDPGVRPAGAVETVLADERCYADFVCDGVHVHPMAIKATLAAKGFDKIILCTDSNVGAGLPNGIYDTPSGYRIQVSATNAARVVDRDHPYFGMLAGSALTMDVGIANLHRWLKLPSAQIWAMGTLNPSILLGLPRKGTIAAGADADLVLWDDHFKAIMTWVGGRMVYNRQM